MVERKKEGPKKEEPKAESPDKIHSRIMMQTVVLGIMLVVFLVGVMVWFHNRQAAYLKLLEEEAEEE